MAKQPFKPSYRGPFNLINRMDWSLRGWRQTYRSEGSFRSWIYANIASALLAFVLPLDGFERLVIIVAGLSILAVELVNTAIEHLADMVEPAEHPGIAACKDAASAGVAIAAIAAGVAWGFALVGLAGF